MKIITVHEAESAAIPKTASRKPFNDTTFVDKLCPCGGRIKANVVHRWHHQGQGFPVCWRCCSVIITSNKNKNKFTRDIRVKQNGGNGTRKE